MKKQSKLTLNANQIIKLVNSGITEGGGRTMVLVVAYLCEEEGWDKERLIDFVSKIAEWSGVVDKDVKIQLFTKFIKEHSDVKMNVGEEWPMNMTKEALMRKVAEVIHTKE